MSILCSASHSFLKREGGKTDRYFLVCLWHLWKTKWGSFWFGSSNHLLICVTFVSYYTTVELGIPHSNKRQTASLTGSPSSILSTVWISERYFLFQFLPKYGSPWSIFVLCLMWFKENKLVIGKIYNPKGNDGLASSSLLSGRVRKQSLSGGLCHPLSQWSSAGGLCPHRDMW